MSHPAPQLTRREQDDCIKLTALGSYEALDYGLRWGIEAMFSDFKSRDLDYPSLTWSIPTALSA